jgi:hypothetical protein
VGSSTKPLEIGLDTFSHARNWKSYWISTLRSYIAGDVLEVGAGLGASKALDQLLGNRLGKSIAAVWVRIG